MSRSWPRVMSPRPGGSTLITSAPSQPRIWVAEGPAWTWLMSSTRMPSSALPALPHGLVEGFGTPAAALAGAAFLAIFFADFFGAFFALFFAAFFFAAIVRFPP